MKDSIFNYYVDLYKSGATSNFIDNSLQEFGYTFDDFVKEIRSRYISPTNRLSEEIKKIIAHRDEAEISRKSICNELNLNSRTVQRACQIYGTPTKYNDSGHNFDEVCELTDYEIEKDELGRFICPISKKPCKEIASEISTEAYYSIDTSEEWHIKDGLLYRVKWEEM